MKTIVLGPPGTGKTHTLLNKVDDYLKETDPDKVGYFAFTKKAANEAKERAMDKFNLSEDDLPYFRTLHSLAFRRLGINKENVMQRRHYEDLGQKINLPLDYNDYDEEETGLFTTKSDYLRIINLAKLRNITIDQQFNLGEHNQDVEYDKLNIIANELDRYKKEYNLIDFNDMILDFVKSDKSPRFDVVFIDEAQDLSRMQWDMVNHFNTQDSFIAGDDDQAIFRWAGADVDSFITQTGKMLHLTQSMRIPKKVHDFAMKIIERVSNRIYKEWKPKTVEGSVRMYESFEDVDLSKGEWMVLTRTRHMLEAIEETLTTKGLYFENKFKKSFEKDIQDAAIDWHNLLKGQLLNYRQLENISKYMGPSHWHKKKMKGMVKEAFYGIDQLVKDYGLQIKLNWFEAFNDCSTDRKEYIRAMRRNGESLKENPRIQLSTIHSVKGGEKQNVVLLTDLTHNTNKAYEKNPDDENRLFYVGATRTKENLHVIQPKDDYKSFQIGDL
jgi:superfamily I DNA/RNA helicase|tara:strand:- start:749 stop:2242 length:1494 start_codon:yes stop_codon:yes gene_type:complete